MNLLPWDINPDLKESRLIQLANFIARVRNDVIERHDESLGDTRLSLGMRAYECCRSRIIEISESTSFSWLSILDSEGRFTFALGDTPVRFTRNDPKYLPDKKLVVSDSAMEQMSLFGDQPYSDLIWFFVFDTYYKSAADAVYFVGYDSLGEIICQWQIPVNDMVTLVSEVTDSIPQAIELEKPAIRVKKKNIPTKTSEE